MPGRDRDAQTDELLRRALQPQRAAAPGVCLEAETLASWAEGRLTPADGAAAEAHAAGCARCQALLAAMVRTADADTATAPATRGLFARLPWLLPLTASAVAVAIWIAVRPADVPPPSERPSAIARVEEPAAPASPAPAAPGQAAPVPRAEAERKAAVPRRDAPSADVRETPPPSAAGGEAATARSDEARPRVFRQESGPPPPAASAPPLESARAGAADSALLSETVSLPAIAIPSRDPLTRWRIVDRQAIELSTDGGQSWRPSHVAATPLTAGSSPVASVCWVVGQGGTVLLTADGTQWQRRSVPGGPDLAAVVADDAQSAVVTTIDGRVFSTEDGGQSWVSR